MICRVCRSSESSDEDTLFYPCKCSGSMKWVHQSCLENWLRVSKKSKCEICDFEFKFSTIYSQDTPHSLPLTLLLSSLWKKFTLAVSKGIRLLIVLFCWTIVAPIGTLFVYESFFNPVNETYNALYAVWSKVGLFLYGSGKEFRSLILQFPHRDFITLIANWGLDWLHSISKDIIEFRYLILLKRDSLPRMIFRGQLVTLGIVLIIVLGLALQELIHSTTPEEELREYAASMERQRANKEISQRGIKNKKELIQHILDKNNALGVDELKLSEEMEQFLRRNAETSTKKGPDLYPFEDEFPSAINQDQDLAKKLSSTIRPSKLPVPSPLKHKIQELKSDVSVSNPAELMKKMTLTSVETVSGPFLPSKEMDKKGKNKIEFPSSDISIDGFCDFCKKRISDGSSICTDCEATLFSVGELAENDNGENQSRSLFQKDQTYSEKKKSLNEDQIKKNNFITALLDVEFSSNLMWYYMDNLDSDMLDSIRYKGPFNWMKMERLLENGTLTSASLVRRSDQDYFLPLHDLLKETSSPSRPFTFFDYKTNMPEHLSEGASSDVNHDLSHENRANNRAELAIVPTLPEAPEAEPNRVENNQDDQQQAFLNINIGPDLRVEIEAQGEWTSLLELIGLVGPFRNLINSLVLFFGIMLLALAVGIAIPRTLGHLTLHLVQWLIFPFLKTLSNFLQLITDPIVDPTVDIILFAWQMLYSFVISSFNNGDSYLTTPENTFNPYMSDQMKNAVQFIKSLRIFSTANLSEVSSNHIAQNGSSSDTVTLKFLFTIFIGYSEMLAYKLHREVGKLYNLILVVKEWVNSSICENYR